jgi:hypothetical protein
MVDLQEHPLTIIPRFHDSILRALPAAPPQPIVVACCIIVVIQYTAAFQGVKKKKERKGLRRFLALC